MRLWPRIKTLHGILIGIGMAIVTISSAQVRKDSIASSQPDRLNPKAGSPGMDTLKNALHILMFEDNLSFAYWNGFDSVRVFPFAPGQSWGTFLSERKQEFGDSLTVVIKLFPSMRHEQAMDLLEELSRNNIRQWGFADYTEHDGEVFFQYLATPLPTAAVITPPRIVTTEIEMTRQRTLFIRIDTSDKADLQYFDDKEKLSWHRVQSHKQDFQASIAKAAEQAGGKKELKIMIVGTSNAQYQTFNNIIQALRDNEIYSYKLITTPDQNGH